MMRLTVFVAVLVLLSTGAAAQTASPQQYNCALSVMHRYESAMRDIALASPRFGIAWTEYRAAMDSASQAAVGSATDTPEERAAETTKLYAATESARQRFIDRILRTAEPEALAFYNWATGQMKAQAAACMRAP